MSSRAQHNRLLRNYAFALEGVMLPTIESDLLKCLKENVRRGNSWLLHFSKMESILGKPQDSFLDKFESDIKFLDIYLNNPIMFQIVYNNYQKRQRVRERLRKLIAKNIALYNFIEEDGS
jgi:hypothetical protein